MKGGIRLLWIGAEGADEKLLKELGHHLDQVFSRRIALALDSERPPDTLDPRRQQHSSGRILSWLSSHWPRQRALAVTDVDLFIPVLTFVFGEAQLGGHSAVVSTARLCAPPEGAQLLRTRLLKEAVHELGHTFGLVHCPEASCAMARSSSLMDVDRKTFELCSDCRSLLRDQERETPS